MDTISVQGFINKQGRLTIHNDSALKAHISCFPNTPCELTITPVKNTISHQQRKYFYGVVVDILLAAFDNLGHEDLKPSDVVLFLKDKWLHRERILPIGGFAKEYISLSDRDRSLTKEEFDKYKLLIQQWAAEKLGVEIPDPDPNYRMYKKPKQNDR